MMAQKILKEQLEQQQKAQEGGNATASTAANPETAAKKE
jgi:hypothetical protein